MHGPGSKHANQLLDYALFATWQQEDKARYSRQKAYLSKGMKARNSMVLREAFYSLLG